MNQTYPDVEPPVQLFAPRLAFDYLKPPVLERQRRQALEKARAAEPWQQKKGNVRNFAKKRQKERLRPTLFAEDPHCCRCGKVCNWCPLDFLRSPARCWRKRN